MRAGVRKRLKKLTQILAIQIKIWKTTAIFASVFGRYFLNEIGTLLEIFQLIYLR